MIGDGMVPTFEEQIARLERNYSINDWLELDSMEKAIIVAVRRIDIAMKNLQTEAEIQHANRKASK